MNKHKWYKEICAWASGSTIQFSSEFGVWIDIENDVQPEWNEYTEYRIKPQPKEPQYVYAWQFIEDESIEFISRKPSGILDDGVYKYIGKIKLESDDE